MSKGEACWGEIPAELRWLRTRLLEAERRGQQRRGPVRVLMGLLAVHELVGWCDAAAARWAGLSPRALLPARATSEVSKGKARG